MPSGNKDVVIALDQGSSSSRALAFDSRGRVIARAQLPVKAFHPMAGWVEHDAEELFQSQLKALDRVLNAIPKSANVIALGVASQRSTVVLWDAKSGKAVCRAPSWQDGRAATVLLPLLERQPAVFDKTGLFLTPYYSAPKIRWLLDTDQKVKKALAAGTLRAAPVASYLIWRLTEGAVFAADPSLAQRTLLFNSRGGQWDPEMLEMFGVPRAILPEIRPSAGDFGSVTRKGRTIPIRAMLGDQQAAALGLGADRKGAAILNYGTGAFFLLNSGADNVRVPGILTSVAWQRKNEPCEYFLEGTVHAVGTSYQWLKENLGLMKDPHAVDEACRASKHRILALQAIGGLGAPRWDYSTFTSYVGMNSNTRPADIIRGVTESFAFMLADAVGAVRKQGLSIDSMLASGGMSRVDHLIQFQSDLLQTPVIRVKERESTAAGAASMAAAAAGAQWAELLRRPKSDRVFRPKMTNEQAKKNMQAWTFFVDSQQKLSAEIRKLGLLP